MYKDATATRIEGLEQERAFEEKFGREMTLDEKKFIGLSDEMFRHEHSIEPSSRRFEETRSGSRITLVPNRQASQRAESEKAEDLSQIRRLINAPFILPLLA